MSSYRISLDDADLATLSPATFAELQKVLAKVIGESGTTKITVTVAGAGAELSDEDLGGVVGGAAGSDFRTLHTDQIDSP